jgi:hypothetical protein
MTGPQIIVLATPVFLALIALEFAVGLAATWAAAGLFLVVLGATSAFLWHAHLMSGAEQAAGAAAIVAVLWLIGLLTRGRAAAVSHPGALPQH